MEVLGLTLRCRHIDVDVDVDVEGIVLMGRREEEWLLWGIEMICEDRGRRGSGKMANE